ncbi:hypothetical protein GHT06_004495 [Daphnia sinensis]|uniref:Uncharacterized protein n=1 Tax=Daphnia sinensis TaxID=1820382 RepID=A0AAD5PKV5_9CRUS|nr:hypothetical protein GHT06_004495 [Daphnia sinensis]
MTWSHGIVGSMPAATDTERIFGISTCKTKFANLILYFIFFSSSSETARLDFIALGQKNVENIRREALSQWAARKERLIIQRERDLENICVYEFLHQSMSCFEPAEHEGINGESTWNGPVVKPRAGHANTRQGAGQSRRNPAVPLDRQTLVVARPVGRPRRNPAPVAEGLAEPRPVDRPHRNPASVAEVLAALSRPVGRPRRNSAPVAEDHVALPRPIGRPG